MTQQRRIVQAGQAGSFDSSTPAMEKAVAERAEALLEGEDLVIERIFIVGMASSRSGVLTAMSAQEIIVRVPPIENCEEIPVTEIDKGDRLLTVPERNSELGAYVVVQDIEIQRLANKAINVTLLCRAQRGLEVRMQMEPGTLVRRF